MNAENIIAAIKEFFLEILGFLIPGIILILLITIQFSNFNILKYQDVYRSNYILLIFIAYSLGYVIYGLAIVRDNIFNKVIEKLHKKQNKNNVNDNKKNKEKFYQKWDLPNYLKKSIQKSIPYITTVSILSKKVPKSRFKEMTLNDVRSFVLTYLPDSKVLIYTFMFRADLCSHLQISLIINILLASINLLLNSLCIPNITLFDIPSDETIMYFFSALIIMYIALGYTRERFLKIALSIPFSIFNAKYEQILKETTQIEIHK